MAKLLIVDDEKNIRSHLATFFEGAGHHVKTADNGHQALALLSVDPGFDLMLTDYRMAEMNGLELLQETRREAPNLAVTVMKAGAYDYLTKPFTLDQVEHVVDRALEAHRLRAENRVLRDSIEERPLIDSHSPVMRQLLETARRVAASEATILL